MGSRNSQPVNQVLPRVSVIGAIDSFGKVYLAISQANTDTNMMKLFMNELI